MPEGEESRPLTLAQVKMALVSTWVDPVKAKELGKKDHRNAEILNSYFICYETGKSNKSWVPVLIPKKLTYIVKFMMDATISECAGVATNNPFLFATTGSSRRHATGSNDVKSVIIKSGAPLTLTATKKRHLVSTLFGSFWM